MNSKSIELLKEIYISYNKSENCYQIKTPPSSKIHEFNMALKEIKDYIEFKERSMMNIKIVLNEKGLEYCMEVFDI